MRIEIGAAHVVAFCVINDYRDDWGPAGEKSRNNKRRSKNPHQDAETVQQINNMCETDKAALRNNRYNAWAAFEHCLISLPAVSRTWSIEAKKNGRGQFPAILQANSTCPRTIYHGINLSFRQATPTIRFFSRLPYPPHSEPHPDSHWTIPWLYPACAAFFPLVSSFWLNPVDASHIENSAVPTCTPFKEIFDAKKFGKLLFKVILHIKIKSSE